MCIYAEIQRARGTYDHALLPLTLPHGLHALLTIARWPLSLSYHSGVLVGGDQICQRKGMGGMNVLSVLLLALISLTPSSSGGSSNPAIFDGTSWFEISSSSSSSSEQPLPPISESWKDPHTEIYVSIVSFRDSERCASTLKDMFAKAKYPDRVRVGLVQQTAQDEKDCMDLFCGSKMWQSMSSCTRAEQVFSILMAKFESKGPSFARYLTQEGMGNAEFCMQTDSHVKFVKGWDMVAMEVWAAARNEYAVLSTSLPDSMKTSAGDIASSRVVPHLCSSSWTDRGTNMYENVYENVYENIYKSMYEYV